jgi:Co/Zn/Cd efflux system component
LGVPFVATGGYVYLRDPSQAVPPELGVPVSLFGLFIIGIGLYIHFLAAPGSPTMRDGEEIIDTRNPAQRAAAAKTVVGSVFLILAGYLLFFTFMPYLYPMVSFVVGLFLFSTGLHTYWTNTLTIYYVTNQRVIKEYRFISLIRQEIPFDKVRGIEERKSIW